MKILILNTSRNWAGTEAHSIVLATELIKQGHSVEIGCDPLGQIYKRAMARDIPVFPIRINNSSQRILVLPSILRHAKNKDVIISNCGNEILSTALTSRLLKIKSIFIVHSLGRISFLKRFLLSRYIDKTIGVSLAVCKYLIDNKIPENKIHLIHNGIEIDRFKPTETKEIKAEFGLRPDEYIIGTAARLTRSKGVFELIEALSMLSKKRKNIRLIIAGDGPERDSLELFAKDLGVLERVIFAGLRNDIEKIYSAMDVFILPSINEPFGLAILEAMAVGKPVIATNAGGIPEIIRDEETGLLVEPRSPKAIAEAIDRLIEEPEFLKKISQAGKKLLLTEFTSDSMAKKYEALCLSLSSPKPVHAKGQMMP